MCDRLRVNKGLPNKSAANIFVLKTNNFQMIPKVACPVVYVVANPRLASLLINKLERVTEYVNRYCYFNGCIVVGARGAGERRGSGLCDHLGL